MTTQMSELEIEQWRDKKRYLWLMGLIAPTALFVMMPLVWAFNQWGWHAVAQVPFWIGPILLYILLPALDLRFGPDGRSKADRAAQAAALLAAAAIQNGDRAGLLLVSDQVEAELPPQGGARHLAKIVRALVTDSGVGFDINDIDDAKLGFTESVVARLRDVGGAIAIASSMAKMYASDVAMRVATDAVQIYGGAGYSRDNPVERHMRDAKGAQIYEGTNQIHRLIIAQNLIDTLRREA